MFAGVWQRVLICLVESVRVLFSVRSVCVSEMMLGSAVQGALPSLASLAAVLYVARLMLSWFAGQSAST